MQQMSLTLIATQWEQADVCITARWQLDNMLLTSPKMQKQRTAMLKNLARISVKGTAWTNGYCSKFAGIFLNFHQVNKMDAIKPIFVLLQLQYSVIPGNLIQLFYNHYATVLAVVKRFS